MKHADETLVHHLRYCSVDEEVAAEAAAAIDRLHAENERLSDLLANALAHTPESYHRPIIELLERKAEAYARKGSAT